MESHNKLVVWEKLKKRVSLKKAKRNMSNINFSCNYKGFFTRFIDKAAKLRQTENKSRAIGHRLKDMGKKLYFFNQL